MLAPCDAPGHRGMTWTWPNAGLHCTFSCLLYSPLCRCAVVPTVAGCYWMFLAVLLKASNCKIEPCVHYSCNSAWFLLFRLVILEP